MDKEEFIRREPAFAKILQNALVNDRVSQAYLLHGSPLCPFEETAMFVAQTLNCESGELACGKCPSCQRFLTGVRPDFMLIDGNEGLIKKEDILNLRSKYQMTGVENKRNATQRMSYVILSADNILSKVANAMLKFLEEPMPGLTAILTTSNIERVLPTIRSRCEEIRLISISKEELYASLVKEGYSEEIAYFLSGVTGDKKRREKIGKDEDFLSTVTALNLFIQAYDKSKESGIFSLMKNAGETLKGSACYNFFYGGLSRYFKDIMSQGGQYTLYKDSIRKHGNEASVAAKAALLLDESIKQANANMSFTGILARLSWILLDR